MSNIIKVVKSMEFGSLYIKPAFVFVDDDGHLNANGELNTMTDHLSQTGEGTSCYYRFLTKGQQWIWLQTRS